MAVTTV